MTILIKINSRIKITSFDNDAFVFSIDANKSAKFFVPTTKLHSILYEFIHYGIDLEKLENFDFQEPSFSRFLMFIGELKKWFN